VPAPGGPVITGSIERRVVSVRGVVQGVGFRPFVYQLMTHYGLTGWVRNTSGNVQIDVEGEPQALDRFLLDLKASAPPLARIQDISISSEPVVGHEGRHILESLSEEGRYQLVSPDIATCPACLEEVFSPSDRRYRYPFTNCTDCGPRFTIIKDIPYDRPRTTMASFTMCVRCQAEYDDPLNRRFHAQPNACPECGPSLWLVDRAGNTVPAAEAVKETARLLCEGNIVALKGLGGFLLACDAGSEGAVRLLRERKKRPSKPFAVMLAGIDEVRQHCEVSPEEEELLASRQCPIVLVKQRPDSTLAPSVAPALNRLGVMLPYTPLHHLLLRETGLPLVMTSGNLSEEPIAAHNDEAIQRLGAIADFFLLHNRDIHSRYDDSVAIVERGEVQLVRRARGYAPYPVLLHFRAEPVLACGAELKNTFCLTRDNHAFVSQHIGDMENLETLEHFERTVELYQRLFRVDPEIVACDMHPDYLATRYARAMAERWPGMIVVPVQHHHAHVVSCMADNGVSEPVIGVALDGTGYGTDGAVWGGEFMLADYRRFRRVGHLEYVPLPGCDAAVRRPYRMAVSYLLSTLGESSLIPGLPLMKYPGKEEMTLLRRQVERGLNSPLTSSCGRLFDAVAALVGLRGIVYYEAQAAAELEAVADEATAGEYPFSICEREGLSTVLLGELFRALLADMAGGTPASGVSARFHRTVSRMIAEMCRRIAAASGIRKVALSGGVFQNRLLLRLVVPGLEQAGLEVLTHHEVPTNDGGVSLGQAVVAASSQ